MKLLPLRTVLFNIEWSLVSCTKMVKLDTVGKHVARRVLIHTVRYIHTLHVQVHTSCSRVELNYTVHTNASNESLIDSHSIS